MPEEKTSVQIPADLGSLTTAELDKLEKDAISEFDSLTNDPNIDGDGLKKATELGDGIESLRTEKKAREQAAAELAAGVEAQRARILNAPDGEEGDGEEGDEETADEDAGEPALVAAGRKVPVEDVLKSKNKLNVRLAEAQKHAPAPTQVPLRRDFDAS